jgi:hypothetical protein
MSKLAMVAIYFGKFAIRVNTNLTTILDFKNTESLEKISVNQSIENALSFKENQCILISSKLKKNSLRDELFSSLHKSYNFDSFGTNAEERLNDLYDTRLFPGHLASMFPYKALNSAVHVAAAVTSQSRLVMYPFLAKAAYHKKLYYTDTDSIFIDSDACSSIISKREQPKKFGFLKFKNFYKKMMFVGQKLYAGIENENSVPHG